MSNLKRPEMVNIDGPVLKGIIYKYCEEKSIGIKELSSIGCKRSIEYLSLCLRNERIAKQDLELLALHIGFKITEVLKDKFSDEGKELLKNFEKIDRDEKYKLLLRLIEIGREDEILEIEE